uniref:Ethylmalonyl-CoA decarboxylase 1 n=1 Tax=Sinocyclocheilus rhinocerous TaxID=307959 RepID=A0A673ITF0_9TELE
MSVCGAARCRGAVRSILQQNRAVCSHTSGSAAEGIRENLQAFSGGSVELQKQRDSGVALLTVNNPARMNAFSGSMMLELEQRVRELETWTEGKAVIVQGAAGTFCSGSDLNAIRLISPVSCGDESELNFCSFRQAAAHLSGTGGGKSAGWRSRTHHCLRLQVQRHTSFDMQNCLNESYYYYIFFEFRAVHL